MVASSGEDGLIEIISLINGNTKLKPIQTTTATESSQQQQIAPISPTRSSSGRSIRSLSFDQNRKSIENDWKYPNAFDEEMYDEWILNFHPTKHSSSNVINLVRKCIMEQNAGSRFPLKCCDMVRKSNDNSYLFFAGGAKEYLQGYQVTYNENKPHIIEWKSLCCTGGDINRDKQKRRKNKNNNNNNLYTMDLRIKSIVVIPSPKYYGKWLIVTGNSRGTIRCYTFDENKPSEFQFEGEDSILHQENNSSTPILSLSSTYSSQTCYHFPNNFHQHTQPNNIHNRIINGYLQIPPHLIFSGSTDGWIRIWFWDIDSHCIQLVERLAIHQSGVNTISASWLDAKFINKSSKNNNDNENINNDDLLTRRLAILSGGDDQSMTLIIADFESTISMSRASRKRAKHQKHHLLRKSLTFNKLKLTDSTTANISSINRLSKTTGWKFNVIREIPINTAHVASIRSVAITPIITPNIVNCFNGNNNEQKQETENNLRMNEILLISTGDDQMLKCWSYKFEKHLFHSDSIMKENIELLDEVSLDIGLPNVLSMYYIYNSGILLSIGGQGIQIVTLPFDKYLFKKIYYNKQIRDKYRNEKNKQRNTNEDNRSSASYDSSFSQNAPESVGSNTIGQITNV